MANGKINVALLGSKFMGRTHSNAYSQVARFFKLPVEPVMHTIAARDAEDLKVFAPRWGWKNYSTDWRDVCLNDEIDLVDVGTPNHIHRDQTLAALEAGKHVACEKPLANTLESAREMVQAAKKAKKSKTFVWYNYRRVPAVALAHQMVKAGMLGRIYHVRGFYLQDWAGPDTPLMWRFQGDVAGSGALGDLCAHSIDMARFVTGEEITEITGAILETFIKERNVLEKGAGSEISGRGATTASKKGKSTVDDASLFLCRFKGGAVGKFEATRLSTGDKNQHGIEVHGEKGALRFNFTRMQELQWYDATLDEKRQGWSTIICSNGGAGHPYAKQYWPVAHPIGYEHSFINQAADMIRILGGEPPEVPLPDFADAYETQRVLAAVTTSAKERSPIKMSEIK